MSTQQEDLVDVKDSQVAHVMGIPCISLEPLGTYTHHKTPATLWVPIEHWTRLSEKKSQKSLHNFINEVCGKLDRALLVESTDTYEESYNFGRNYSTKHYYDFHPGTNIIVLLMDSFQDFLPMLSSLIGTDPCHIRSVTTFSSKTTFTCAISSSDENPPQRLDTLLVIASRDAFFR